MWNTESDAEESFRKKVIWGSAAIVVLGILGTVYYHKHHRVAVPINAKTEPTAPVQPAPQAATEPQIRNPIPAQAEAEQLPPLQDSDPHVREALTGVFGAREVAQFLVPQNVVRHTVVTIDNLPRKKVAVELRPVKPTPGGTVVAAQAGVTALSDANFQRYTPFVKVVQNTDMSVLANTYFRLYPLFQQSYEDLGYPGQYFNDRLVEAIDDMLQAPDPPGPLQVTQPKVFYQFADPELESLSAGQKLMLRIGPANEAIMKGKLREFRAAIVNRPDQPVTH